MSFYKNPIRPFDPVVEDDAQSKAIRYYRDDFTGSGQNSYTQPPAQDQSMWEALTNIMPITRGSLDRRWGYNLFAAVNSVYTRAYSFQRDIDNLRTVLFTGTGNVTAFSESGSAYNPTVFTPSTQAPIAPRMIDSRSSAYFFDGYDTIKWDGSASGGTSAWGFAPTSTTSQTTTGPKNPTAAASSAGSWTNVTNIEAADGSFATNTNTGGANSKVGVNATNYGYAISSNASVNGILVTIKGKVSGSAQTTGGTAGPNSGATTTQSGTGQTWGGTQVFLTKGSSSKTLFITGFGFNIPVNATINGITVAYTRHTTSTVAQVFTDFVNLVKNNAIVGTNHDSTQMPTTATLRTLGNSSDLWGASWTASDINGGGFGVAVAASETGGQFASTAVIDSITISVNYTATGGNTYSFDVTLMKNGANYGSTKTIAVPNNGANTSFLLGSNTDLWGGNWLPNDVNATNWGVNVVCEANNSGSVTWSLDSVQTTVTSTGPTNAISVAGGAAGAVTLTVGRIYYYCFQNSVTGHLSDLGPSSGSSGPVTNLQLNLTTIPVASDPQVDTKIILATADGGDPSILYYVAEIPNATTTYTDNTPETTLLLNQTYLFTDEFGNEFGVSQNDPPPSNATVGCKHKGRLWLGAQQNLFFSKSVAELTLPDGFVAGRYEEAWPGDNYFDISAGAETIQGLLSNGEVLFVGTQKHIYRLFGDGPDNFQEPEIVHPQTGLANQEVWRMVFLQGTPAGAMWLTPDNKVLQSDFNTFVDVGHPIQNLLNLIDPTIPPTAEFLSDGEYDIYMLAFSTIIQVNYQAVYDVRSRMWCVWQLSNTPNAILYNVTAGSHSQWLFVDNSNVYLFSSAAYQDNGANFAATAKTSWLHLGAPTSRKVLDELEVIGDGSMLVSIDGASMNTDFTTPNSVVASSALTLSPFQQLKVYLSGEVAKDRYYRITFTSSTQTQTLLNAYNFKAIPWNTL